MVNGQSAAGHRLPANQRLSTTPLPAYRGASLPRAPGRCLHALADAGAEAPLAEARELFASMGYEPALAETEKLLAAAVAASA